MVAVGYIRAAVSGESSAPDPSGAGDLFQVEAVDVHDAGISVAAVPGASAMFCECLSCADSFFVDMQAGRC